jgi:hypothetical protein
MTNEMTKESTFDDCAVAGCRKMLDGQQGMRTKQKLLTKAISSLMLGIDTAGTKAAYSTRLLCPLLLLRLVYA